jgi:hypothetical protein
MLSCIAGDAAQARLGFAAPRAYRAFATIAAAQVGALKQQRWKKETCLRTVTVRVCHGATKMLLERWTDPTLSRRTCKCEYGLQSCRGKLASVAKRPRERSPTRNPQRYDSQLLRRCRAPRFQAAGIGCGPCFVHPSGRGGLCCGVAPLRRCGFFSGGAAGQRVGRTQVTRGGSAARARCPASGDAGGTNRPQPYPWVSVPAAPVEGSRASPPHRPREDWLAHCADTSRTNRAAALALLSRWRLSKPWPG